MTDEELVARPWFSLSREDQLRQNDAIQRLSHRNEVVFAAANARARTLLECTERDSEVVEAGRKAAWFDHDKKRITRDAKGVLGFPDGWPDNVDPHGYVRQTFTKDGWDALESGGGMTAPSTNNKWTTAWREKLKKTTG